MLMYGPPGTGKSRLARHIAGELGLELYVARLDGLISSFLGSTSKNIRALFDFAAKTPCVLFLDEFDAIAKLRGDTQELGELKRVVNSFIQNLDSLGPQSIVLAATNHEELSTRRLAALRLPLRACCRPDRRAASVATSSCAVGAVGEDATWTCSWTFATGSPVGHPRGVACDCAASGSRGKTDATLADAFQALQNIGIGEGDADHRPLKARSLARHREGVARAECEAYSHAALAAY